MILTNYEVITTITQYLTVRHPIYCTMWPCGKQGGMKEPRRKFSYVTKRMREERIGWG